MGSSIRFSSRYSPNGTNVNFFNKISDEKFEIRTYERGVEDETSHVEQVLLLLQRCMLWV